MSAVRIWLAAFAMLAAMGLPAHAEGERTEGPGDPTWNFADSAAMDGAIQEARSFLPRFWATFDNAPAEVQASELFAVKAGLRMEGDEGQEHIWVGQLAREGDQVRGVLLNEPNRLGAGLALGSPVSFGQDQISDWWIVTQDGMYGGFTLRVMLAHLPPEVAAEQAAMLSPTPAPPSWRE